jgi:hypothetical protein
MSFRGSFVAGKFDARRAAPGCEDDVRKTHEGPRVNQTRVRTASPSTKSRAELEVGLFGSPNVAEFELLS